MSALLHCVSRAFVRPELRDDVAASDSSSSMSFHDAVSIECVHFGAGGGRLRYRGDLYDITMFFSFWLCGREFFLKGE